MKITAILAACFTAVGATSIPGYKAIPRTDNYDRGTALQPVNDQEGGYIRYNAFGYGLSLIPPAPSGRQVIGTGIRAQAMAGQPAFLPRNEKVKCFDMKSIRNACISNTQGAAVAVPFSCTVQFSARSALTGQVQTKPAIYNPPLGSLTQPFNTTTFPSSFTCIDRVDITLLSATLPGDSATLAVVFDDFSYVAYVKQ